MNKVKKYSFSMFLTLSFVILLSICSYAEEFHYATTDMTWAEFYAGEVGETQAELEAQHLDAISTPTTNAATRFPVLDISEGSNGETGQTITTFSGYIEVPVRMSEAVYNSLSDADKERFEFVETEFDEYKTLNADGSFSAMVTETEAADDAVVSLVSGASARWGHYVLSVSSADINIGTSNDKVARNYLGVKVETSDGKIYGMRHDNNIWSNTDIAFCVNENYVEPHGNGVVRDYRYTADIAGKTITKITYMLKDLPDVVINCNVALPEYTSATVKPKGGFAAPGTNVAIQMIFNDVPEDASYTKIISVYKGSGHGRTDLTDSDYSYSNGVLTINGTLAEGEEYHMVFADANGKYIDIGADINVSNSTDYYATTDMTYAEFYAGELGTTAETLSSDLDAISSATDHFPGSRFVQLVTSTDENGCNIIYGVKDVQVKMSKTVYDTLTDDEKSDKGRYKFSTEIFDEYKEVASDGSFGAMSTDVKELSNSVVTVSSGASSSWGHYTLAITEVDSIQIADYLGATVETSDGKIYGLRHLNNLWVRANAIAFVIDDTYSEPHGAIRYYAHTADIAGKTITKITYMLKNQPDIVVNCNAYLPLQTNASVKPQGGFVAPGTNVAIKMIFSDIPEDASYTKIVSVYKGSGRGRTVLTDTDYIYSNGVLTINGTLAEGEEYHMVFADANGKYIDIRADIVISDVHYATTDMTYAEFYAGELGTTAAALASDLDAISSATDHFPGSRFVQLVTSTDENGCNIIYGVKDVQVKMNKTVYDALTDDEKSDKGRYKFSTEIFDEYKEVANDGNFSAMSTDITELTDSTVTVSSGASSTWGHYTLAITGVDDIQIADYLGATVETSDGKIYGLRHLNNLWVRANAIAFVIDDTYSEPHGAIRYYAHTADIAGKTITKITYMLKNQPDIVVNCNAYLPEITNASVVPSNYGTGYGTNQPIKMVFSNVPSDAKYDSIVSLTRGSGRGSTVIEDFTYSDTDKILKINYDITDGQKYYATFRDSTEKYSDIRAEIYTTVANAGVITQANNSVGIFFMLTPAGVVDEVDEALENYRLVNATNCVEISDSYTAAYSSGERQASGTGFTINIALSSDKIAEGYTPIVGFGNPYCTLTADNLGDETFAKFYSYINNITPIEGYRPIPDCSALNSLGLHVMAVQADGVVRDISKYTGAGATIVDDKTITLFIGTTMIADCNTGEISEGEYMLSDEGEYLISDGVRDNKLNISIYIAVDDNGGGTNPPVVPTTTILTAPKMDVEAKKSDIVSRLKEALSSIPDDVEVEALSDSNSTQTEREISDVSDADKKYFAELSQDIAVVLPEIEVSENKIYVFNVSLDKLSEGALIFWHSMVEDVNGDFVKASEEDKSSVAVFYNSKGEEVNKVPSEPSEKNVDVAAYFETGKTYAPVITTSSSGSGGGKDDEKDEQNSLGSSSGCNSMNIFASALMLLSGMVIFRRK